ncbi:helix-turn-helix domain-containing protein [Shewanella sp.]|uniref:helix-turn-helix domain-containing protein n=1 Tax=Shewanella sp. TaxID=50422 RepID=UPI003A973D53
MKTQIKSLIVTDMENPVKLPPFTSAEAINQYPPGLKITQSQGKAWNDLQLSVFSLETEAEQFSMPVIPEPMIVWVLSGHAETQEREINESNWHRYEVKQCSLYLTAGGVPYEFRWRRLSPEPFRVLLLVLNQSLFDEALKERFGNDSNRAYLEDRSGIDDPQLVALLELLRIEHKRSEPSKLFVDSIAKGIAVHLARQYTKLAETSRAKRSALPAYRLKQITHWMRQHMTEEFSLAVLAQQAQLSEFHFNRLFKQATGMPPSRYHIKLRIDKAKQLLRETNLNVLEVAMSVGYANSSHFARLFRKETGTTPSAYRCQN